MQTQRHIIILNQAWVYDKGQCFVISHRCDVVCAKNHICAFKVKYKILQNLPSLLGYICGRAELHPAGAEGNSPQLLEQGPSIVAPGP